MNFRIAYHPLVPGRDLPKLSSFWLSEVERVIEEKLTMYPEVYGKPLSQSLKGYRKLRVGDYRAIFRIDQKTVKIFIIEHRSVVYKLVKQRLLGL